ncbi:MAG: hypothetical protein ACW98D_09405 [Promethearchaeota archaeon]|jgi:hypothetical protein
MKNGVIHTIKTHTTAFNPFFLASLYTHITTNVKIVYGTIKKTNRSMPIKKYKSL